jgi:hypothetical protein
MRWSFLGPVVLSACHSGAADVAAPMPPATPHLAITGAPELVEVVSSEYSEVRIATSPDGRMRLWGSTDRPGGPGGWNVWMTTRTADGWRPPAPAPFDSDANDFDPAFSADGGFVYFFSNRPGGMGGDDIYRVPVRGDAFGAVEHLGPEVNTAGDEWAPAPAPDGSGLLFASNRPHEKHDLWFAPTDRFGFHPAARLPGAIDTAEADEFDATFLADGRTIVFARSTDVENDPIELDVATRGPNGYDRGTPLPASVNTAGGYTLGPAIDGRDHHVLYFSSKRSEASRGKLDVYRVPYTL